MNADVVEEVLQAILVNAHIDQLLGEGLLPLSEEVHTHWLLSFERSLLGKSVLDLSLALLACSVGHKILSLHVSQKLSWNLLESLLGKLLRIVLELAEWYELYNISLHVLLVLHGVKWDVIGIEDIHAVEVITANADDDDADREAAASSNDLINSLLHIVNDTISDDQQDIVLLVLLADLFGLSHVVDKFNDRGEVGGAIQVDFV